MTVISTFNCDLTFGLWAISTYWENYITTGIQQGKLSFQYKPMSIDNKLPTVILNIRVGDLSYVSGFRTHGHHMLDLS